MTIRNDALVKKLKNNGYFGLSIMQRELRCSTIEAQRKLNELERLEIIESDKKSPWRYKVKG